MAIKGLLDKSDMEPQKVDWVNLGITILLDEIGIDVGAHVSRSVISQLFAVRGLQPTGDLDAVIGPRGDTSGLHVNKQNFSLIFDLFTILV